MLTLCLPVGCACACVERERPLCVPAISPCRVIALAVLPRTHLRDAIRQVQNRLPAEVQGTSISVLSGVVTIDPPYSAEACTSANSTVMARVQRLLDRSGADATK